MRCKGHYETDKDENSEHSFIVAEEGKTMRGFSKRDSDRYQIEIQKGTFILVTLTVYLPSGCGIF